MSTIVPATSEPVSIEVLAREERPKNDREIPKEFKTKPWLCGDPFITDLPRKGEHWAGCIKAVKDYDGDLCQSWRDEIENLLIFAGLFSATVTAFVIESYKSLQADPVDKNSFLLEQVLLELRNANNGNQSTTPFQEPPTFSPSAEIVRVNVLWFVSLTLALGTVVLGILCLQWIREYQRNIPLDPQETLAIRQLRYQGLAAWRVPEILASLPVLLITSLALFFAGLLILLWSLHRTVALAATIVIATFSLIFLSTTFGPSVYLFFGKFAKRIPRCPWKSPQAWIVHKAISCSVLVTDVVLILAERVVKWTTDPSGEWQVSIPRDLATLISFYRAFLHSIPYRFVEAQNWVAHDRAHFEFNPKLKWEKVGEALIWSNLHLAHDSSMIRTAYHCLNDTEGRFNAAPLVYSFQLPASLPISEWRDCVSAAWLSYRYHPEFAPRILEGLTRVMNPWTVYVLKLEMPEQSGGRSLQPWIHYVPEYWLTPITCNLGFCLDALHQLLQCCEILVQAYPDLLPLINPSYLLYNEPVTAIICAALRWRGTAPAGGTPTRQSDVEITRRAITVARMFTSRPTTSLNMEEVQVVPGLGPEYFVFDALEKEVLAAEQYLAQLAEERTSESLEDSHI